MMRPQSPSHLVVALAVAVATSFVAAPSPADPTSTGEPGPQTHEEPRREITLEEAISLAEQRNLTLAQARSDLEIADARVRQSFSAVMPSASASMTYTHLDHADEIDTSAMMGGPAGAADPIVMRRREDLAGAITVRLPLVNPAAWAQIGAASTAREVTDLSTEQIRRAVVYGTARAFYAAMMSRELVSIQEEQIASTQQHLEVAHRKEAAGTGLRLDVLRAKTDLEQARQDLEDANLSLESACDALGVLTGIGGLPLPSGSPRIEEPETGGEDPVDLALATRRDLRALRMSRELSEDQLTAAWMALLPTVNATWQGTHQFTEMSDMGDPDDTRWSAMVTLSVPLFDWNGYGAIGVQRASLERASLALEDAEQAAGKEVRQARREYLSALRSVENASMRADLAEEMLHVAQTSYEAGAGTSLDVTDARRTASSARVALVASQLEAQLSLIALLQALGEDPNTTFR